MGTKVNLGGGRLQSGSKMEVELPHYERSTHNLTEVWKSTMSPGTVVPILGLLGQPEDTMDIEYDVDIQTEPTLGALYGSFKFQIDTFKTPISLYNGLLLINETDFDAKKIFLPEFAFRGLNPIGAGKFANDLDNYHTDPSSIFRYMGVGGAGCGLTGTVVRRDFPALKWLIYWDVVKNYYANKQETNAWVIHNSVIVEEDIISAVATYRGVDYPITENTGGTPFTISPFFNRSYGKLQFTYSFPTAGQKWAIVLIMDDNTEVGLDEVFDSVVVDGSLVLATYAKPSYFGAVINNWRYVTKDDNFKRSPELKSFPLENIDYVRRSILRNIDDTKSYIMDALGTGGAVAPYLYALEGNEDYGFSASKTQEGLALKTYQSDKFNNWLKTESITGAGGVNELSRIDVSSGYLEIEALQLGKAVYRMLNAITAADKTYSGFQQAVWGGDGNINETSPVFIGGLSKEIGFQEVVSTGGANENGTSEPLGTIVGRGRLTEKHNGGRVSVKVWNPSYITAYASITPYINYSQGNLWDMNYKTLDDWHKPALDQIGWEDRIVDEQAWWSTFVNPADGAITFQSAGKQPAWLDYMTSYDSVYGNFAIENNLMFMVLTRRYEFDSINGGVKDLTTYIDPSKFNHIFAQSSLDAMNFRVMIRKRITARRKISAKVMPQV